MGNIIKKLSGFYSEWILETGEINILIILITLIDLWWGIVLMHNSNIFSSSSSFSLLDRVASEDFIAIILLTFAVLTMISAIHVNRKVVNILSMMQLIFWFFITYTVIFSNPFSTGTGIYAVVGLICGTIFLRTRPYESVRI